jgi:hypothetical protein
MTKGAILTDKRRDKFLAILNIVIQAKLGLNFAYIER